MHWYSDIQKKIGLTEVLTILFVLSVGVSVSYKYGFYKALGVEWYIGNFTPQQLFISSLGLAIASLFGLFFGTWLGHKIQKGACLFIVFLQVGLSFLITKLNGEIDIKSIPLEFLALLINFNISLWYQAALKEDRFETQLRAYVEEIVFSNKYLLCIKKLYFTLLRKVSLILKHSIFLMFCLYLMFSPYFLGYGKGKQLLRSNDSAVFVQLKNGQKDWILIDINGDKVLLMKKSKDVIFKILEYKEVEEIKPS